MPPITTKSASENRRAFVVIGGGSNEISYVLYTRQNLLVQDNAPLAILAFSDRHLVGLG